MRPEITKIPDFNTFEQIAYSFFNEWKKINSDKYPYRIIKLTPPGVGADGGKDFFVWFEVQDHLSSYVKKWLVQCKWKLDGKGSISPSHLKDDEITTLTHSYDAQGYLLITNAGISQKLINQFERLTKNCHLNCVYTHWNGTDLMTNLWDLDSLTIWKTFFPDYHDQIKGVKT